MSDPVAWQDRRDAAVAELRGEHPWIPGATFIATPGLAEYLADVLEDWYGWEPEGEFPGPEHTVTIRAAGCDTTRECYCTATRGHAHHEFDSPWITKNGARA